MSEPRKRPDPTEGFRLTDEELERRERERRERERAAALAKHEAQKARAQARQNESPTPASIGPFHVFAEIRKIRHLIGWLVMLIAIQFSIGFGIGFFLLFEDAAKKDTILGWMSVGLSGILIAAFAYLIFRPPAER